MAQSGSVHPPPPPPWDEEEIDDELLDEEELEELLDDELLDELYDDQEGWELPPSEENPGCELPPSEENPGCELPPSEENPGCDSPPSEEKPGSPPSEESGASEEKGLAPWPVLIQESASANASWSSRLQPSLKPCAAQSLVERKFKSEFGSQMSPWPQAAIASRHEPERIHFEHLFFIMRTS